MFLKRSLGARSGKVDFWVLLGIATILYVALQTAGPVLNYYVKTVEKSLLAEARERKSITAYNEYLDKFPDGKGAAEAREAIDVLTFEGARGENTIEAFNKYLDIYPKGKKAGEAKAAIDGLYFSMAGEKNSIEAYEDYLKHRPDGAHAQKAREAVEKLTFEKARDSKSVAQLNDYLEKYPKGAYRKDAEKSIESVEFEYALNNPSFANWENFINKFPNGAKTAEAGKQLADFAYNEALAFYNKKEIIDLQIMLHRIHKFKPELIDKFYKETGILPVYVANAKGNRDIFRTTFQLGGFTVFDVDVGLPAYRFSVDAKNKRGRKRRYSISGLSGNAAARWDVSSSAVGKLVDPKGKKVFSVKASHRERPPKNLSVVKRMRNKVELNRAYTPTQEDIAWTADNKAANKLSPMVRASLKKYTARLNPKK